MVANRKAAVAPYVRNLLRYASGFIAGRGIFTQEMLDQIATDPQIVELVTMALLHSTDWILVTAAAAIAAGTEAFYKFAKKRGWAT